MGQNSARADSPHAARRRLLESHGQTEKFPTLVSQKPGLKRCAFGQSWPSVLLSREVSNVGFQVLGHIRFPKIGKASSCRSQIWVVRKETRAEVLDRDPAREPHR